MVLRQSEVYPAPTLDAMGRPVDWAPVSYVEEAWGFRGVAIDGVSVTRVRGVPTEISAMTLQEPFGEGPAQLLVKGASLWDKGGAGFEWLRAEANVDITHYLPNGTVCCTLWCGIVTSLQPSRDGWSLDCDGAFAGPSGMFPHRPKLTEKERDIGRSIVYACRRAAWGAARRKTITEVETGISTRDRGSRSETLLEYVSRLLGMAQTAAGDQWTMGRVLDDVTGKPIRRKYGLFLKDRDTVHVTVSAGAGSGGARGVDVSGLRQDLSQVERFQMAEWVDRDGGRGRNVKLPNVGKETIPTYPGTPLDIGSTGNAVRVWQAEAMTDGHRTGDLDALIDGSFDETDADAAEEIQEDAGLPVTGIVDEATWNATWSNGDTDLNLGGARFDPIAADPRVIPWLYSSNGSVLAANPDWDRTLLPVGRYVSYGQNVSRKQVRRSAKAQIARASDVSWFGTVVLTMDPEEMSRLHIREGMNLKVRYFDGAGIDGILLHIADVHVDAALRVTLTVDQRARDRLTIAEIQKRNRDAKQDPIRLAISQLRKSAQTKDTPGTWDSEGGFGVLPYRDAFAGRWNVYKVAAGQYGTLSRVLLRTDPPTRFAVALFGAHVTRSELNALVPDPLAEPGSGNYRVFDRPSIRDDLNRLLFIENFGLWKQAAGYSPGYETDDEGEDTGHDVTGKLDVDSGTNYALADEPKMWVAIWPVDDTRVRGQIRLLPNE